MTVPASQATGLQGAALADEDPTETVVVAISPPPPPPPHGGGHRGISPTTQHLLIAAGSIGATIIIVMIIMAIYTMRKRGLTLSEAVKQGRNQVTRRGPPPPPKAYRDDWEAKNERISQRNITPPPAAMARTGSFSSQRPLMALERNDSFHRQGSQRTVGSQRSASPRTQQGSFLLESPPPPPRRNNSHRRNDSNTPSSPVLGDQNNLRRSASTRNTRSIDDDASELRYNDPPQEQERALSPLPPPPTFKQFLFNRPSMSGKPAPGGMASRFSWTNSNAPQTPREPGRDENTQIGRDSYMTTRSSVPRFRTVDSWVNQQTNRLEEQKLKEQFRLTSTSTVYSEDNLDQIPEVPAMPRNVQALRENSTNLSNTLPPRMPGTPPPQPTKGLPGKNIRHERHDTRTTVDTAPIFRQHPGTEVRFSTRSAVPSEILDRGRNPTVLS
ncbi:hypothetical protein K458DRAFT_440015 [Lentithecium fluviatile CBS 122367]|uniref:Uncharacterized protein n=1 Tax=Lentithecium fluviatile CBS 122367 TaxID=1168545 RepID=A0A6G1JCP6_9PLEO|nr:hypothetical protein K458DRAFT_440015 [Lentithecium fluviatile CBS 122367]